MRQRVVRRYSLAFQRQVVEDLEAGRFASQGEAQRHFGITGNTTIRKWICRLGKNHLLAKVVRAEKPDEANQMAELKRRIAQLEQALGRTQAEHCLNGAFLELACERLGQDVESFKKKPDGKRSTAAAKSPAVKSPVVKSRG